MRLSIASLALDPTDPTHQTLIAGTGATSNGGFASISLSGTPAFYGGLQTGLLYSRNGGTTWTQLGAATLSGQSVVGIAALGATILAATFEPRIIEALKTTFTGGLYRNIDCGATFAAVSGAPGSGLPAGPVSSLVSNPNNPNILYAALTASDAKGDLSGWRRLGSGLPNATIFALSYNEKSDTLAVGTVGRGAYLLCDVTSNFARRASCNSVSRTMIRTRTRVSFSAIARS